MGAAWDVDGGVLASTCFLESIFRFMNNNMNNNIKCATAFAARPTATTPRLCGGGPSRGLLARGLGGTDPHHHILLETAARAATIRAVENAAALARVPTPSSSDVFVSVWSSALFPASDCKRISVAPPFAAPSGAPKASRSSRSALFKSLSRAAPAGAVAAPPSRASRCSRCSLCSRCIRASSRRSRR